MKRYAWLAVLAIGAAGCQESTSTGPADKVAPTASNPSGMKNDGAPKKLTVMTAESQTLKQGDTDKILVTINRDNFNDAVTINLDGLPAGVSLVGTAPTIAAGDNSATIEIKADPTAAVGDHAIKLVAKAPGLDSNEQTFTLKVQAASGT